MDNVSKRFYFGSYLAAMVIGTPFAIGPMIAGGGKIQEEHLPFTIVAGLFGLYGFVVFLILIYKMWKAIPSSVARTTPGKAVGFLFIPVFNLYWWFIVLRGWAQDWNTYAAKSGAKVPRVSEALPLGIAALLALGGSVGKVAGLAGAPWIGTLLTCPNCVLIPLFILQVCNVLNKTSSEPAAAVAGPTPIPQQRGPRSLGITSLVLGILSIPLPYLGLGCGIAAIVFAKKQRKLYREPLSTAGLVTGIIGTAYWGLTVTLLLFIGVLVGLDVV
ncbi:MAG: hypothetical protein ISR77_15585 [Pirellulaceae bacterium]|nr:hypothetical protein [Pirellulaceae bacterium]